MTIEITRPEDFQQLAQDGLRTVVDPMILRCGELFLKGSRQADNPDEVWSLLSANIYGLGMFFDSLVLNEQIPVFNYGDTFDMGLNFDQRMLARVNDYGNPVLFDVNVQYDAYWTVKRAALDELKKISTEEHPLDETVITSILSELAAAEYKWVPHLSDFEATLNSDDEKQIARFLFGGLIFTGYAQLLGGEHLMQPKRSRLFLDASLNIDSDRADLEKKLFKALKERAQTAVADVPWLPTFFPYLLSQARTPTGMLEIAGQLRGSKEVVEYRQWLGEVMELHRQYGRIPPEKEGEIRSVVEYVDRQLGSVSSLPKLDLSMTIADVAAFPVSIPGKVDITPVLSNLWGWMLASLPGKRYRKLLTKIVIAERQFTRLDRSIKTIWQAG